ncbi:MAG TPA: exosortase [Candidatus Hydrogenedentes bacterium]|nr:exosortase [Candidatus Hydrogenedentota bacterium]
MTEHLSATTPPGAAPPGPGAPEPAGPQSLRITPGLLVKWLVVVLLLAALYRVPVSVMRRTWNLVDSYYSHGILIPPVSLFLIWRRRRELLQQPVCPSSWGLLLILGSAVLLVLGAFLGFTVFGQFSLIPMLAGLVLALLGKEHLKVLWFPILFLLFMIPIPPALTQSITFNLKLVATESAVGIARALTFPMIQEGSFVHFKDDFLLIGNVCGGLRSLISLLAIGALMAYFSKARLWARILILALSCPIAVVSNICRIFLLCLVGYFWGSEVAAGRFHDVSGFFIYGLAFVLFAALEASLRRIAPAQTSEDRCS